MTTSPKLDAPPIIEVMCGISFEPIVALDPIAVGDWRHSIPELKNEYPSHVVHPAITESPGFFVGGVGPLRSWLVSRDDEWIIQVQADRFYVNWRQRTGVYPRFSDHDDGKEGVLTRALREFTRFSDYCKAELGTNVIPNAVELAKVDQVAEGKHWKDFADLGSVIPLMADIGRFTRSAAPDLSFNLSEGTGDTAMQTSISLSTEPIIGGSFARAVKIETRGRKPLATRGSGVREAFAALNETVNNVFFGLISPAGLDRFKEEKRS